MDLLRTFWVERSLAVLAAVGVLAGAVGAPVQAAQQPKDPAHADDEEAASHQQRAAASGPAASVLYLSSARAATSLSSSTDRATDLTLAGVLAKRVDPPAAFTSPRSLSPRTAAASSSAPTRLHGIVWPMGP